jgi:hypothetical protein
MLFDKLQEKIVPLWRAMVSKNEWQITPVHLLFLSQYLGTSPCFDDDRVRAPGMRVRLDARAVHPRIHLLFVQMSGSGKGSGQRLLTNLIQYINIRLFMQRFGVTDIDELADAVIRYEEARRETNAALHASRAGGKEAPEKRQELPKTEGTEDEEPSEKKSLVTKSEMAAIRSQIMNQSGNWWTFFWNNTDNTYPVMIQPGQPTIAALSGGFEDQPNPVTGKTSRIWIPGGLEKYRVYMWDEAKNILYQKTPDAANLNAVLCAAMDHDGTVTTQARRHIQEDGNQKFFSTNTSIYTGTTKIDGLDSTLVSNGLLQRFIIGFHGSMGLEEEQELTDGIIDRREHSLAEFETQLKEYYDILANANVYRGIVTFSKEANDYQKEQINSERAQAIEMFGVGTMQYNMVFSFRTRRIDQMAKIAGIIAALDGEAVVKKVHMEKAYETIGKDTFQSILNLVDECTGNLIAPSERMMSMHDNILMTTLKEIGDGRLFVTEEALKEKLLLREGWGKKGDKATIKYIREWMIRNNVMVETKLENGKRLYAIRRHSANELKLRDASYREDLDNLEKEQAPPKKIDWGSLAPASARVEHEDDMAAAIMGIDVADVLKKRNKTKEEGENGSA